MSCQPEELAQPAAVDSVPVTRRLANDAIFEAAERFGGSDQHLYQFVCECGSRECHELPWLARWSVPWSAALTSESCRA